MTTSRQLAIGALLIGSSFLAADVASALFDRQLHPEPVPFSTAMRPVAELGLAPALEGLLGAPAASQAPARVEAPAVRLHGTVLSEGAELAVLETSGDVRPVAVGESVDGWTLVDVEPTRARFARADQIADIRLGGDRPVLTRPPVDAPPPVLTRDEAQVLMNDPALSELVRVHPAVSEGRMAGLRLEFVRPSHVLAWLGLRDGDVLLAVNDQPLLSLEDLHRGWNVLKNSPAVSLQVQREGQAVEVRYEFAP